MWFFDVNNYKKTGENLTKEKYIKQKFGPVPQRILSCVGELQKRSIITVERSSNNDYKKTNYCYNKKTFDKSIEKQEGLNALIEGICNNFSASQISEKNL